MNYFVNFSRLSRLHGSVGLLSSRVVHNTAYAGDACGLLEGERVDLEVRRDISSRKEVHNSFRKPSSGNSYGLQLFEH